MACTSLQQNSNQKAAQHRTKAEIQNPILHKVHCLLLFFVVDDGATVVCHRDGSKAYYISGIFCLHVYLLHTQVLHIVIV